MPEVPRFAMYSGCVLDQLSWQMQRSGLLTATAQLVAQGETVGTTTAAGTPAEPALKRFGHFNGSITRNGAALGNVVSAEITYANNLDRIETIRSDGRIDGADPSIAALTGRVEVRFADQVLVNQAIAGDPCELEFAYALPSGESFTFTVHAVYLPRPRIEIAGPQGVQATFDWQAARDAGRGPHVHRYPRQRRRGILRVRSGLEAENPFDVGRRVPANPDVIPDPIDVDAAGAAERRSLARHVGVRRPAAPDQPLRETGIELPVTGSSLMPAPTANARTSNCASGPSRVGSHAPTTPILRSSSAAKSGSSASTSALDPSSIATQPGPLSIHWASRMLPRSIRSPAAIRSSSASSGAPERISFGAAKASRPSSRRMGMRPMPHSCTIRSPRGCPPAASHAWQLPRVGCPANGGSSFGVKMRTR